MRDILQCGQCISTNGWFQARALTSRIPDPRALIVPLGIENGLTEQRDGTDDRTGNPRPPPAPGTTTPPPPPGSATIIKRHRHGGFVAIAQEVFVFISQGDHAAGATKL